MPTPTIGAHLATRRGDTLHVAFTGPMTREDVLAMRREMSAMLAQHGACWLVGDMHRCAGIESGARQYFAAWSRAGGDKPSGVVVYGLDFAMRTIVSLTLSAIRLLGAQQTDVHVMKTEAEALRWLAAERETFTRRVS